MPSYNLNQEQKETARNIYIINQTQIIENWNPKELFEITSHYRGIDRTIIEIGSGNGNFLIHLAEKNKNNIYIGIEIKRKRISQCAFKSYKRNLDNIRFIMGDAKIVLINRCINDESVDDYYLTFPDPWPKSKHKRNRIVDNEFVSHVNRSLKNKGRFIIATDHRDYLKEILDAFDYHRGFRYQLKEKISSNLENFYQSYFEQLWRDKGKKIYYCILIKN